MLSLAEGTRVLPLISLGRGRPLWGWGLSLSNLGAPRTQLECHYLQPQGDLGCSKRRKGWAGQCGARPCLVQFPPQPSCSCEAGSVRAACACCWESLDTGVSKG